MAVPNAQIGWKTEEKLLHTISKQLDRLIQVAAQSGGGGGGTVTSVSVATANGFAGTVATATTTPAITISTSITGILKGNGTAISAAVAADFPALPYFSTVNGGTASGTITYTLAANPFIISTGVTTGTGATAGQQIVGNSLTTGNILDISSSSVSTGTLGVFTSTSTVVDHTLGTSGLVRVVASGVNSTTAKTVIGISSIVTNTNVTSGTNVAAYFSASGATTANNAVVIGSGNIALSSGAAQTILKSGGQFSVGTSNFSTLNIVVNSGNRITINGSSGIHTYSTPTATSGSLNHFTWNPGTVTNQTASTEAISYTYNTSQTNFLNGAITTQRNFLVKLPTYSHVSGSNTITTAATFVVEGAPTTTGAFTTITNAYALWVQAGNSLFAGSIAIGNTVNAVSPTAPNRTVTMVIGGTTYYLHAKTTND